MCRDKLNVYQEGANPGLATTALEVLISVKELIPQINIDIDTLLSAYLSNKQDEGLQIGIHDLFKRILDIAPNSRDELVEKITKKKKSAYESGLVDTGNKLNQLLKFFENYPDYTFDTETLERNNKFTFYKPASVMAKEIGYFTIILGIGSTLISVLLSMIQISQNNA